VNKQIILSVIVVIFVSGCVTSPKAPDRTQLQIRAFQTRQYDTTDEKMVLKSAMNVLADDGYIVKNAVPELGLLTAEKELDIENKGEAVFAAIILGYQARWKKSLKNDCTVNVSKFGESVKVRLIFQVKVLDNHGNVMKIEQIQDPKVYQEFFAKMDKGFFIEKEGL